MLPLPCRPASKQDSHGVKPPLHVPGVDLLEDRPDDAADGVAVALPKLVEDLPGQSRVVGVGAATRVLHPQEIKIHVQRRPLVLVAGVPPLRRRPVLAQQLGMRVPLKIRQQAHGLIASSEYLHGDRPPRRSRFRLWGQAATRVRHDGGGRPLHHGAIRGQAACWHRLGLRLGPRPLRRRHGVVRTPGTVVPVPGISTPENETCKYKYIYLTHTHTLTNKHTTYLKDTLNCSQLLLPTAFPTNTNIV